MVATRSRGSHRLGNENSVTIAVLGTKASSSSVASSPLLTRLSAAHVDGVNEGDDLDIDIDVLIGMIAEQLAEQAAKTDDAATLNDSGTFDHIEASDASNSADNLQDPSTLARRGLILRDVCAVIVDMFKKQKNPRKVEKHLGRRFEDDSEEEDVGGVAEELTYEDGGELEESYNYPKNLDDVIKE
jgi:hypothetical protein